ncbi:ribonuclease H-like YkuK family protein [Cytobacillus gottheilii]
MSGDWMETEQENSFVFQNLQETAMSFDDVFSKIISFMRLDPRSSFRLMVGTDSQVHPDKTLFITGIVIQREGKGAWACIKKMSLKRKMHSLHERISYETALTEEVVSLFTNDKKIQLADIVLPFIYSGASFVMEGHLDIGAGKRNKTREYVQEMVARIQSAGFEPVIKPDAFVASSYANKYTK